MAKYCKSYIIYLLALCLVSCQSERTYFPKDIAPANVEIVRFDSALLQIDTAATLSAVRNLYQHYPEFMPVFTEDILGIYTQDTLYLAEALPKFLNDTLYGFQQTNQRVKETFSNIDDIRQQLNTAFGRLLYLYPEMEVPTIYFFVSGFNASILFVEQKDIAVGIDMYLGSDYEYYNRVVYNYQKQTMRKECIATDVVSAYLFKNIPFTSQKNRLLEQMLYRGKIMYLLSLLMEDEPEYEVMGYTKAQWDWCKQYERNIWQMIIDKKDLFKTEPLLLTSYLNDGPFTSEISQDAPARLGTWIGWQIAKSYMKSNPDKTLRDLLEEGDAQKILEESYYKP